MRARGPLVALALLAVVVLVWIGGRGVTSGPTEVGPDPDLAPEAPRGVVELLSPPTSVEDKGPGREAQDVPAEEPRAGVEFGTIQGTVRRAEHGAPTQGSPPSISAEVPLAGVQVEAHPMRSPASDRASELEVMHPPRSTRTDGQGRFIFEAVLPGRWSVRASWPDHVPESRSTVVLQGRTSEAPPLVLRPERKVRVKLRAPGGLPLTAWRATHEAVALPLSFDLVETVTPLPSRLATYGGGRILASLRAAEALVYSADGLAEPARYEPDEMSVELAGWSLRSIALCTGSEVLAGAEILPDTHEVEIVVPLEVIARVHTEIRARVLDAETGSPLAGARATIVNPRSLFTRNFAADANGHLRFEEEDRWQHWVLVSAEGYGTQEFDVTLAVEPKLVRGAHPGGGGTWRASSAIDLGAVSLRRAATISGTLSGVRSGEINIVTIPLDRFERARELRRSMFFVRPNKEGSFAIDGLDRGRYLLRLDSATCTSRPLVLDTTAGSIEGVLVHAESGSIVTFEVGRQRDETLLRVVDERELPVQEVYVEESGEAKVRLVPGEYEWWVEQPGRQSRRRAAMVSVRDQVVKAEPWQK